MWPPATTSCPPTRVRAACCVLCRALHFAARCSPHAACPPARERAALRRALRQRGRFPSDAHDALCLHAMLFSCLHAPFFFPTAAELAALEFGKIAVLARRGGRDAPLDADAVPRPAVVTVMG